ncbi:MAG: NADH oxidoreductase (quinone) subunit F [Verrucomicrobia bacterium]|nr:MAG: NADH oxidoreductase (quinone) subunit F [Verrucomicrobiota bacterium]
MNLQIPAALEQRMDEIITHYPPEHRRAAVLWLLHLLQEHCGCLGREQVEWTAAKLGLPTINVWELIRFYPMFSEKPRGKFHIKVCRTLSCAQCGCGSIFQALEKKLGVPLDTVTPDGFFTLSAVECLAACGSGPAMMINDMLFEHMTPEKACDLIDKVRSTGGALLPAVEALPLPHPLERRVLLANMSRPGYRGTLEDYVQVGGYDALKKALTMRPEDIVGEVANSELRGRGGAGFPCGMKWRFLDRKSGKPIYLICNADESEPGTFKDRQLIYRDPHQLIEGMLIACYAIGAKVAYIYVRGEFPDGAQLLEHEIAMARAKNLLGKNILGHGFDCEIYVHRGAGAYICGEETGLIESLEGKRAYPRIKPPFPAVRGLFGCPTVVNNVETLCNVPLIVKNGAAWFNHLGVLHSTGTRILSVSGSVKRPGVYEIENGKLTLRQLIFEVCGGTKGDRPIQGVIPGGSSMPILPADKLDIPLDFESIRQAGSAAGSGAIIVLDDADDIVGHALNVAQFYAHESCGQCTPCREGTLWMEKLLHRLHAGGGRPEDVGLLQDVADNIDGQTICALGEAAAWPIKAFLKHYRGEFEKACAKEGGHHDD